MVNVIMVLGPVGVISEHVVRLAPMLDTVGVRWVVLLAMHKNVSTARECTPRPHSPQQRHCATDLAKQRVQEPPHASFVREVSPSQPAGLIRSLRSAQCMPVQQLHDHITARRPEHRRRSTGTRFIRPAAGCGDGVRLGYPLARSQVKLQRLDCMALCGSGDASVEWRRAGQEQGQRAVAKLGELMRNGTQQRSHSARTPARTRQTHAKGA